ncbi:MAG: hypothetical protein J0J01_14080 [Reyranella sp.]|uniref:hypothetical protein n=1 Tax=Reyranella sp. TaxID=1929291 RepID=UPI001AD3B356|nr:hypothetical protein [Reyranella sp.]MBN9088035.1 hypothetical protein [Reyranella sp.]
MRRSAVLLAALLAPRVACASDVDTQFIFGFTQGADVGTFGEKEIESQTLGRFGKADGAYTGLVSQLRAEFTPLPHFRFEVGTLVDYHSVSGVTGFDSRDQVQFGGFVMEGRYQLLDRRTAPIGLTIGVEPHWQRVDETSGELVTNYGGNLTLAIDKELVEDRLFAALNIIYDPEWTHVHITDTWQQQSTLGVSGAAVWQIVDGVFVGGESHYLRAYDGIGLASFAGEALFIGPTAYWQVTERFAVSGAWSLQVAGGAVGVPGGLNLRDFERHQVRLRFEYTF